MTRVDALLAYLFDPRTIAWVAPLCVLLIVVAAVEARTQHK
jgi:hypothetical protein